MPARNGQEDQTPEETAMSLLKESLSQRQTQLEIRSSGGSCKKLAKMKTQVEFDGVVAQESDARAVTEVGPTVVEVKAMAESLCEVQLQTEEMSCVSLVGRAA